jgi:uncharacterized protein
MSIGRFRAALPARSFNLLASLCIVCACATHGVVVHAADLPRIQSAAARGDVVSEIALGDAYFRGEGVAADAAQAAYWYERAASSGNALAQNQVGYFYQAGIGVQKDEARAAHWFQLAAASGFLEAKVNLGVEYYWGSGVRRDPRMAERLFEEAARSGSSAAMTDLGDMYYSGLGVPRDPQLGESWYEKAIKLHDGLAEYRMGMYLSQPDAHPRNLKRSIALLRESAAGGVVPALHSLGLLLVNHPELCTSHEEALTALGQASDAGSWQSTVVLGILARDGKWMPQDTAAAYVRFRESVIQGGSPAEDFLRGELQRLSSTLGADRAAQLDKQAREWASAHKAVLARIIKTDHERPFAFYGLEESPADAHAGAIVPNQPGNDGENNMSGLNRCTKSAAAQDGDSAAAPATCPKAD